MSTSTDIDLKELAIRRQNDAKPMVVPKRRIVSRVVLPGVLITGFTSVLAWASRDVYLPRTPVTVVPVRVSTSEIQTGGTPLFNAAGWVEPRPTPIRVAALASGVVEELLVVEDQLVSAGEPIARLVDEDAVLLLEQTEAVLKLRESEVQEAEAAVRAAQVNFDIPAHLELPVAESEAALAAIETELSNLPHQKERAEARLALAKFDLETSERLSTGQVVTQLRIEKTRAEYKAAQADVGELTQRKAALLKQQKALERQVAAADKRLELKTDEQQALDEANARLLGAKSRLKQAEVAVDEAKLRLSRMVIPAPVDGRILNLVALPGSQLTVGMGQSQGEDRSTVVKMYEPNKLQVRVDVRFEDLPRAGRGQPVEIRSPAVPEPLVGRVLFLTGYANIQKNTLEVKVSIDTPPDVLKPEMLVDVTFLAPETTATEADSSEQFSLFVPRSLVQRDRESTFVWVADVAEQVARRKQVSLGKTETPSFIEVTEGLTAASRLIATGFEQLNDGDRINITGEATVSTDKETSPANPSRLPEPYSR